MNSSLGFIGAEIVLANVSQEFLNTFLSALHDFERNLKLVSGNQLVETPCVQER